MPPLQFARPQQDVACLKPPLHQVEHAAAQNDEADDERKGAGIDARGGPADTVTKTRDHNGRAERAGEEGRRRFQTAPRDHHGDL